MGRLTIGRSESVFSTKMLAPCSLWASGRMKGRSAEAVGINHRLDELRASALAIYREQSAVREQVTAEDGTTWIKAVRKKTNVEFEIPLLDLPLRIINKNWDIIPNGKMLPYKEARS